MILNVSVIPKSGSRAQTKLLAKFMKLSTGKYAILTKENKRQNNIPARLKIVRFHNKISNIFTG